MLGSYYIQAPDGDDISDAEKVYHECQQDGPVLFEDCIPPEQMKRCSKIGEGMFGEVFSTVNGSSQTLALKIIPVEGSQKVNGDPQKMFGEILHEIIISKEMSSLDSNENNRTSGFIGLNNLHCVRGCYPSALLKAWDKSDQEKESENDRPGPVADGPVVVVPPAAAVHPAAADPAANLEPEAGEQSVVESALEETGGVFLVCSYYARASCGGTGQYGGGHCYL
ncbi:hypothetical protein SRHO_G00319660 [Serrasalmus rhombeus]